MNETINQFSETGTLKKVIIGLSENYRDVPEYVDFINKTMKKNRIIWKMKSLRVNWKESLQPSKTFWLKMKLRF